jgi:hypothetical protein
MIAVQPISKPKFHENIIKKMPLLPPKQRTVYRTYLYFAEPEALENICAGLPSDSNEPFSKIAIEIGGKF